MSVIKDLNAITEYRNRRQSRIDQRREDDEWKTINGTHVMVDEGGQITRGPEKLKSLGNDALKPSRTDYDYDPSDGFQDFVHKNAEKARPIYEEKGMEGVEDEWYKTRLRNSTKDLKEIGDDEIDRILDKYVSQATARMWLVEYNNDIKPKLVQELTANSEVRNACLNIMYENYKDTGGKLSFKDFLLTPIKMYRGGSGKEYKKASAFSSYTLDRKAAEKFKNGPTGHEPEKDGEIYEAEIRPIDTYGSLNTSGEMEILVPRMIAPNGRRDSRADEKDWNEELNITEFGIEPTVASAKPNRITDVKLSSDMRPSREYIFLDSKGKILGHRDWLKANRRALQKLYEQGEDKVDQDYYKGLMVNASRRLKRVPDAEVIRDENYEEAKNDGFFRRKLIEGILKNKKARNAALNIMYDNYCKAVHGCMTFEEFLNTPIKMNKISDGDVFSSYGFMSDGGELTIRPIDTFGSIRPIPDAAVMIPWWRTKGEAVRNEDKWEWERPERYVFEEKLAPIPEAELLDAIKGEAEVIKLFSDDESETGKAVIERCTDSIHRYLRRLALRSQESHTDSAFFSGELNGQLGERNILYPEIGEYQARKKARLDAKFEENEHPRDESGKFTSGGSSSGAEKTESRSAKDFLPSNSYQDEPEHRAKVKAIRDAHKAKDEAWAKIKDYEDRLAKESTPKPKSEWDDKDELDSLLGRKPMSYSEKGEKIKEEFDAEEPKLMQAIREADAVISDATDWCEIERLKAREKQLAEWKRPEMKKAEDSDYEGFTLETTGTSFGDEHLKRDGAIIAEMSPREYLERCAYEIFDQGTMESVVNGVVPETAEKYRKMMEDGTKFHLPYLNYRDGGQEGRHRAVAAHLLGIEKMPVLIIGKPPTKEEMDFKRWEAGSDAKSKQYEYESKHREDAADDEGRWITTENNHKVHLNEEGEPDKGNPHVIEKMEDGEQGNKQESLPSKVERIWNELEYMPINTVFEVSGERYKKTENGKFEMPEYGTELSTDEMIEEYSPNIFYDNETKVIENGDRESERRPIPNNIRDMYGVVEKSQRVEKTSEEFSKLMSNATKIDGADAFLSESDYNSAYDMLKKSPVGTMIDSGGTKLMKVDDDLFLDKKTGAFKPTSLAILHSIPANEHYKAKLMYADESIEQSKEDLEDMAFYGASGWANQMRLFKRETLQAFEGTEHYETAKRELDAICSRAESEFKEAREAYRNRIIEKFPTFADCKTNRDVARRLDVEGIYRHDNDRSVIPDTIPTSWAASTADEVSWLAKKYPFMKGHMGTLRFGKTVNDGVYGESNTGGAVVLNEKWYSKPSEFSASYWESVRCEFHPHGTSAKSVVDHEYGHQIDDYLTEKFVSERERKQGKKFSDIVMQETLRECLKKNPDTNEWEVARRVSEYATHDKENGRYSEFFAEAFAAHFSEEYDNEVARIACGVMDRYAKKLEVSA